MAPKGSKIATRLQNVILATTTLLSVALIIAVNSSGSNSGVSSSTAPIRNLQSEDYREKEVLGNGITLDSQLQAEVNVRNGMPTPTETLLLNQHSKTVKLPKRLFLHGHYYNKKSPALRDVDREEAMSMLFVLHIEKYSGKHMIASLVKGYGRDLLVQFYHPVFKEYVKIQDENDANEFLSSLLLKHKYIDEFSPLLVNSVIRSKKNVKYAGDMHGHVYVSYTGNGLVHLAASQIGLWNISQKKTSMKFNNNNSRNVSAEEAVVLLGQVDIGVDNVLGKLDKRAITYEFPRHAAPSFSNPTTTTNNQNDNLGTKSGSNQTLLHGLYQTLNVKEQIVYCHSPNAFAVAPKIFKRKSNYFFCWKWYVFHCQITYTGVCTFTERRGKAW